ncbi:hypothetical protein BKA70DRAFT_1237491 [Coprinopsis sp. MPI-PUGE-AT-0042]|nr:hypothetical protein BKA70DRAFT_1237491 [Coprinopsis sp. MPI-PUGE-AT-0042]
MVGMDWILGLIKERNHTPTPKTTFTGSDECGSLHHPCCSAKPSLSLGPALRERLNSDPVYGTLVISRVESMQRRTSTGVDCDEGGKLISVMKALPLPLRPAASGDNLAWDYLASDFDQADGYHHPYPRYQQQATVFTNSLSLCTPLSTFMIGFSYAGSHILCWRSQPVCTRHCPILHEPPKTCILRGTVTCRSGKRKMNDFAKQTFHRLRCGWSWQMPSRLEEYEGERPLPLSWRKRSFTAFTATPFEEFDAGFMEKSRNYHGAHGSVRQLPLISPRSRRTAPALSIEGVNTAHLEKGEADNGQPVRKRVVCGRMIELKEGAYSFGVLPSPPYSCANQVAAAPSWRNMMVMKLHWVEPLDYHLGSRRSKDATLDRYSMILEELRQLQTQALSLRRIMPQHGMRRYGHDGAAGVRIPPERASSPVLQSDPYDNHACLQPQHLLRGSKILMRLHQEVLKNRSFSDLGRHEQAQRGLTQPQHVNRTIQTSTQSQPANHSPTELHRIREYDAAALRPLTAQHKVSYIRLASVSNVVKLGKADASERGGKKIRRSLIMPTMPIEPRCGFSQLSQGLSQPHQVTRRDGTVMQLHRTNVSHPRRSIRLKALETQLNEQQSHSFNIGIAPITTRRGFDELSQGLSQPQQALRRDGTALETQLNEQKFHSFNIGIAPITTRCGFDELSEGLSQPQQDVRRGGTVMRLHRTDVAHPRLSIRL